MAPTAPTSSRRTDAESKTLPFSSATAAKPPSRGGTHRGHSAPTPGREHPLHHLRPQLGRARSGGSRGPAARPRRPHCRIHHHARPEARGRGLGAAATRLTLDYAFHITSLRMVWLKVLAPNTAGIRAYEKAGFHPAGNLREAGYWIGQMYDEFIMDAVASEFAGPSSLTC
ncbi:GNAT family N-acetyltransferase [Streptomyces sp. NPDC048644]|uniref:GNAT family N-acetyltransferase n=1 Tax=Streptomyces sp. NPDC048644 TaxID=3365582 RepID=UPI00371D9DF7